MGSSIVVGDGQWSGLVETLIERAEQMGGFAQGCTKEEASAVIFGNALRITQADESIIRSVRMWVVSQIAKDELYLLHPVTGDFPKGYTSLNDMLRDIGFSNTQRSILRSFGEVIVPYLEEHGISIEEFLSTENRPKLEAAIPALKSGIRDDDEQGVLDILDDVRSFSDRSSIRAKYSHPRGSRPGRGSVMRLDGTSSVVTIVVPDDEVDKLVRANSGMVEWGMLSTVSRNGNLGFMIHVHE